MKTVTTYKASDGKEFNSAEDAERYETLKTATDEFDAAARKLNMALAATLKTADGQPLQFNGSRYHIVCQRHDSEGVVSESLYPRDCWIEQTKSGVYLHYRDYGSDQKIRRYDLADIYASERAANLKVLEIRKRRAEWLVEDIAKLEQNIARMGD